MPLMYITISGGRTGYTAETKVPTGSGRNLADILPAFVSWGAPPIVVLVETSSTTGNGFRVVTVVVKSVVTPRGLLGKQVRGDFWGVRPVGNVSRPGGSVLVCPTVFGVVVTLR
jgi:hypothetical protein